MTNGKYNCFFISPMKEENSPERKNSNAVITLILQPVLSKYNFNIDNLRSDQGNTPNITDEMIRRLKEDELGVADLSDLNPNVLWEYGYRYAFGKPIIALMAREHGSIPFDLHNVRIIHYPYFADGADLAGKCADMETAKRDLEAQLLRYIESGFCESETIPAGRLEHIEQMLKRIEDNVFPRQEKNQLVLEDVSLGKSTERIDKEEIK